MEIGGGRIIGKESIGGAAPTEFALYNADQYMKPEGAFTTETAADGYKWYKQTPQDTVQRTPYMDANGDVKVVNGNGVIPIVRNLKIKFNENTIGEIR
jgi:hypothetical protein